MAETIAYKISRVLTEAQLSIFEEALEPLEPALNMGLEHGEWHFTAFFDPMHGEEVILALLEKADAAAGVVNQPLKVEPVANQDWQQKALEDFPPLHVGSFFIHSFPQQVPQGAIDLHIPANMAFGTGEHPTTSGCLALYEALTTGRLSYDMLTYKDTLNKDSVQQVAVEPLVQPLPQFTFKNGLDMGCGSAILAMAAAKKDAVPFVGIDIDAPSIDVANENVQLNGVQGVTLVCGDGFNHDVVQQNQPYDLIFANILMQPLLDMSAALAAALGQGGVAILSGFLTEQKAAIQQAYTALGLKPLAQVNNGRWAALALQKK